MTSLFNKTLYGLVATLFLLASCSLDTPQAPPNDNPWDPANPSAPRAPIGLTGQVLSETSLSLSWQDNSGNESGFIIEEGSGDLRPDSLWVAIDTVAANIDSLTLENRHPATEYRYRVLAFNPAGRSTPPANALFLNTTDVRPSPPADLELQTVDGLRVKLVWQDHSSNESAFQIERAVELAEYALFATVTAESTTWESENLDPFTTYFFRVRAINDFGSSLYAQGGLIQPGEVTLSAPYDVTAEALSETEVEVRWNDSNLVAESFQILQSLNDSLHFNHLATVGSDTLSLELASQLPNTSYFYRIVAQNRLVSSSPSFAAHASTAETIPWPPSNFSARVDNELDVILNWHDNSGIETGYRFELSDYDDFRFAISSTIPSSTTSTRINNFEGEGGNVYIRMCSVGEFGNSAWIAAPVVTPGAFAPQPPSNLRGEAIDPTYIVMRWLDNSRIEEKFEFSAKYGNNQWRTINFPNSNMTIVHVPNCLPSTSYTFRIRATNRFGSSNWIQSPIVTTPGPPQAPISFSAEGVTSSQIDINWAVMGATHQGFILEDSLYGAETWRHVDSIKSPAARSYRHESAARHQLAFYRIKSYNEHGNSGFSNIDAAMPYAKVAYIACNDLGIVAVDVTDPADPVEIRRLDTPGLAQKIFIENDRAYVADSYGGVEVFDISSPARMFELGSYETYGRAYNLLVENSIAYIAAGDSGLEIVDFTNPASPQPLSRFATAPGIARGVAKIAGNLYVTTQDRGVLRLNVSNRRSPSLVNEIGSPSSSQGICVHHRNTHVIVAEYSAGVRVLTEYLEEFETIPLDGNSFDIVRGPAGYVIQYYVANFNRGVIALSINPNVAGYVISTLPMPDDTWGVAVADLNLLLAAVDNAGLKLINIADSSNPSITSTFQTPGPARGVAVREYR